MDERVIKALSLSFLVQLLYSITLLKVPISPIQNTTVVPVAEIFSILQYFAFGLHRFRLTFATSNISDQFSLIIS